MSDLYFFRDSNGNEVDVVFRDGRNLVAIEIKSASTFFPSQLKNLTRFKKAAGSVKKSYLVYSGEELSLSGDTDLLHFTHIDRIFD